VHVVDGRVDRERVPRGDQRLLDARGDHHALENVLIAHDLLQQALGRAVCLNVRNQRVQLFAQLFVQRKVILERFAPFLAQLEHFLLVAVVVLPQHLRRVAAQMPACGEPLRARGVEREGQNAAITPLQLVGEPRNGGQQLREALVPLREPVKLRQQLGADLDVRVDLPQQAENARHPPHVLHDDRRDQLVALARRPVAAVPVAPERQEGRQGRVGEQRGVLLARRQRREVQQDFVGLLLGCDADIQPQVLLEQFLRGPVDECRRHRLARDQDSQDGLEG